MSSVSKWPEDAEWRRKQGEALAQKYPPDRMHELAAEHGSPVLLLSIKEIRRAYQALVDALPNVEHHYALKPLPDPRVVEALRDEGASFDLASSGEVDVVRSANVDPARCIHTHPIKLPRDVEYAKQFGVDTFVFDNPNELDKLERFKGDVDFLMRVGFPNADAQCNLSAKFGVPYNEALALLETAVRRGFRVKGLSFHVGSQMGKPHQHVYAIEACKALFDDAAARGIGLEVLDLGGGWPVPYVESVPSIEEFARPIREELASSFSRYRVISEPGRFIAAPAVTLLTSVTGFREIDGVRHYHLDDGIYASYSGILFDHGHFLVYAEQELRDPGVNRTTSVLWGPTCDSIDKMYENVPLPVMRVGDLLASPMMGAYAGASHATRFNLIDPPKLVRVD